MPEDARHARDDGSGRWHRQGGGERRKDARADDRQAHRQEGPALHHDRAGGFAGAAADGFACSLIRDQADEHAESGARGRSWRDRRTVALRRLEAMMLVADARWMYLLSGTGDLIEPDDGVMGIGSGGAFAMAAARALVAHSTLDTRAIVEQAMAIAADICVYTNPRLTLEEI